MRKILTTILLFAALQASGQKLQIGNLRVYATHTDIGGIIIPQPFTFGGLSGSNSIQIIVPPDICSGFTDTNRELLCSCIIGIRDGALTLWIPLTLLPKTHFCEISHYNKPCPKDKKG